jgi:hypothetical protein
MNIAVTEDKQLGLLILLIQHVQLNSYPETASLKLGTELSHRQSYRQVYGALKSVTN